MEGKDFFREKFEEYYIGCKLEPQRQLRGEKAGILKALYRALPEQVRLLPAIRAARRQHLGERPDPWSHRFALSFANYLMNQPCGAVERYLSCLANKEDRQAASRLLAYYLKCAFSGKFPVAPDAYGKMLYSRIRKEAGHYRFEKWRLPENKFIPEVFVHHHGLRHLPSRVALRISGKDVLDIGAGLGDSACVLSEYCASGKVYSFEADGQTHSLLERTIALNGLSDTVVPVRAAVWEKQGTVEFDGFPRDIYFHHREQPLHRMECTSIDAFLEGKKSRVGLIKLDIEGFELEALLGAQRTIRRQRPVVLAAVYHTGKDFFEIPRFLRSCHPGYRFRLLLLNEEYPMKEAVLAAY